ncbi:MAG TPA: lysoplasmalogenase [Verrucomicrobiae bacterium]
MRETRNQVETGVGFSRCVGPADPGLCDMANLSWQAKVLSVAGGVSAVLTISAGGVRLGYVFMPLTTTLILLLAVTATAAGASRYKWSIVAGLVCSLAGDVFLMLPRDLFLAGLSAFLMAHLCYLMAFTSDSRLAAKPLAFLLWGAVGVCVVVGLWSRIPPALQWPVALYAVAILCMAAQAASRALTLRSLPATLAAAGATLFVASDVLLAVRKFAGELPASRLLVLGTYFSAQWLIAISLHPRARHPPSGTHT